MSTNSALANARLQIQLRVGNLQAKGFTEEAIRRTLNPDRSPDINELIDYVLQTAFHFSPRSKTAVTDDDARYQGILQIINRTGVEIERHPVIYKGNDEEALRDHFVMVLSSHFDSVTGETFNKTGKTDILIRHEGRNVFVAECGIWKGAKGFLGKIDQLLSYLTLRDSRAALILFVRNKEFGPVFESIKKEIVLHSSFVKADAPIGETSLLYEFTLKDDASRPIKIAVLCFHFP